MCSHPVLARAVFRLMQEQPGLSAATGPFAKTRLPQPGEDSKFFVVAVFFATMLGSRPARALLFPLTPPTQQKREPHAAG